VRANIEAHRIELIHGDARLAPDRTVHVAAEEGTERVLQGDAVLIATGSRPFHPPGIDFDDPDIVDSATVLELDRPVARLAIIGGGAVGCEYASIFRALGTEVTLIDNHSRLVPFMDVDVSNGLADVFRSVGINVVLATGLVDVARDGAGLALKISDQDVVRPDKLLFAAGRVGNTDDLGLAELGIATDERGRIVVDDRYRTGVPGVYAAGDVVGPPALASVSMEQARVAACDAFGIAFKQAVDPIAPVGVYSIPEAAGVGLTQQEAAAQGIDYEIGVAHFAHNSRAIISGTIDGFVKLVFRRKERGLLGVHILGESATELVHHGQAVLHLGGSIDCFIQAVYNVPTLTETYKYAAYNGLQRLASA
jgi:NAD(P) transhydrogenase